ncbi:GTP-binding protein Rhes [Cyprinodon tularosa]|uniref:GTP-binding protein Rhes n=1 Tax=Cyprinodon tularosa TaxID=77115 RepID=UPI0018E22DD0|nr:GTP-binding protein Rhes [Cyprinodon tularosa]
MNSTEKFYFPVDGILEVFNSFTGHPQPRIAHQALQSAALIPRFQPPKVSHITKTGMGIFKTVKGCWRRQDKRVVSRRSLNSGHRQMSTDRLPKKPVDLTELGAMQPKNCHRIVVLGAPRVGKTNILRRFLGEEYEEQYEPTTEDFYRKMFHIGGETYQIDLLDAASERDFPAKRRLSILTGDIFVLVFSLDDRDSLNEVRELLNEIKEAKSKLQKSNHLARFPAVVCANKADLDAQRVISTLEVMDILGEDAPFFEISAKTGAGLESTFAALAALGGLPNEISPSLHQIVPILTYQSMCIGKRGMRRGRHTRGLGAPCAAVDPLAQRPSFTSDLRLVLGSSTKHKKPEKCQIQ